MYECISSIHCLKRKKKLNKQKTEVCIVYVVFFNIGYTFLMALAHDAFNDYSNVIHCHTQSPQKQSILHMLTFQTLKTQNFLFLI